MKHAREKPIRLSAPRETAVDIELEIRLRLVAHFLSDDVRSKADLRDWKPGVTFHFDRSP